MTRFIDLSVSIQNDVKADPEGLGPEITYLGHQMMAENMAEMFTGVSPDDFPNGEGWAVEEVHLSTHAGTHMDAPYHYASTMNHGKPAATIDQIPLDWCFRPGVKLDFRHFADGHIVTKEDVKQELERINYKLKPFDIVLIK